MVALDTINMSKKSSVTKNSNIAVSKHIGARISPRKVRSVANFIRGKNLEEVVTFLTFDNLRASKLMLKIVNSAYSNATNKKLGNEKNEFLVKDVKLGAGTILKKGRFGGRGKFKPIMKRTSHISVYLEPINSEAGK